MDDTDRRPVGVQLSLTDRACASGRPIRRGEAVTHPSGFASRDRGPEVLAPGALRCGTSPSLWH
ncbi:MAG: hypothetical protein MNPFHGCM_00689 [Gemmatimonadaceae bacterium]|nr:hypothetical protein [Gemmatimonadaceae bacterium]